MQYSSFGLLSCETIENGSCSAIASVSSSHPALEKATNYIGVLLMLMKNTSCAVLVAIYTMQDKCRGVAHRPVYPPA
jgi:hypothetical protein